MELVSFFIVGWALGVRDKRKKESLAPESHKDRYGRYYITELGPRAEFSERLTNFIQNDNGDQWEDRGGAWEEVNWVRV